MVSLFGGGMRVGGKGLVDAASTLHTAHHIDASSRAVHETPHASIN